MSSKEKQMEVQTARTAKYLQEELTDSGSAEQPHLHKYDLCGRVIRRKPFLYPHYVQHHQLANEYLTKAGAL